jgi:Lysozyme like domain
VPRLSPDEIEKLWVQNGGHPIVAPVAAAIAMAESGGDTESLNDTPATGDYSVGLWQINYYNGLRDSRTKKYGTPEQLLADPNRQAKAAIDISGNGGNFSPWTTYTTGAYRQYLSAATVDLSNVSVIGGTELVGAVQPAPVGGGPTVAGKPPLTVHLPGTNVDLPIGSVLIATAGGVVMLVAVVILLAAVGLRSGRAEAAVRRLPGVGPAVAARGRRRDLGRRRERESVRTEGVRQRERIRTEEQVVRAQGRRGVEPEATYDYTERGAA